MFQPLRHTAGSNALISAISVLSLPRYLRGYALNTFFGLRRLSPMRYRRHRFTVGRRRASKKNWAGQSRTKLLQKPVALVCRPIVTPSTVRSCLRTLIVTLHHQQTSCCANGALWKPSFMHAAQDLSHVCAFMNRCRRHVSRWYPNAYPTRFHLLQRVVACTVFTFFLKLIFFALCCSTSTYDSS